MKLLQAQALLGSVEAAGQRWLYCAFCLLQNPLGKWGFPKIRGTFFWGLHSKAYGILGFILGSHFLGKLPNITSAILGVCWDNGKYNGNYFIIYYIFLVVPELTQVWGARVCGLTTCDGVDSWFPSFRALRFRILEVRFRRKI